MHQEGVITSTVSNYWLDGDGSSSAGQVDDLFVVTRVKVVTCGRVKLLADKEREHFTVH